MCAMIGRSTETEEVNAELEMRRIIFDTNNACDAAFDMARGTPRAFMRQVFKITMPGRIDVVTTTVRVRS